MIIYRSQVREREPHNLLAAFGARLRNASTQEQILDLLIDFGELEAALLDAIFEFEDEETELSRELRRISCMIARAFIASVRGESGRRWLSLIPPLIAGISGGILPRKVLISIAEGYAYYALYPEQYLEAARRFRRDHGTPAATVIGIRSIGTSLSAVVAEGLERDDSWSFTVRPRGHPFDRRLSLAAALRSNIARRAGGVFLVVDEGPGLSGSSFAAVSRELVELGVDERRIFLFPSWQADPERFVSEPARRQWMRHQKYVATFEEVLPQEGKRNLSAGNWRATVFGNESDWPPVQPHHERRKYLDRERRLWRFAGLGSYGLERYEIASQLDEGGYIPNAYELDRGFLISEFVDGSPLGSGDVTEDLLKRIAAYLGFRRRMPASDSTPFDEIRESLQVNTGELLGRSAPDLEDWRSAVEDAEPCRVDGRMLPHEWLATSRGYLKTDAIDHHADHFFPGCVDIAWDVAATCVEWGLDLSGRAFLIRELRDSGLIHRLPFYEAAYLAFRGAYASMAAGALGESADARRFRVVERQYRDRLAYTLAGLEKITV